MEGMERYKSRRVLRSAGALCARNEWNARDSRPFYPFHWKVYLILWCLSEDAI